MTDRDLLDLLGRALDQTHAVIAEVRRDQTALPTPCRSWDVSQLINHVVLDTRLFSDMASGARYQPGEIRFDPGDWLDAFQTGSAGLLAAWRERQPFDAAAANRLSLQIAEFAVHSWDIVRATAPSRALDYELAAHALAWAQQALKPEGRGAEGSGKVFGPEVAISPDAPLPDRLAAFFGREPWDTR